MASPAGRGDLSEIKAGRIICLHGRQIIAAEIIHQTDRCKGILAVIQLGKNLYQILCDLLITNQFPVLRLSIKVDISNLHITKILKRNDVFGRIRNAIPRIGQPGDSQNNLLRKRFIREAVLVENLIRRRLLPGNGRTCL